MPQDIEVIVRKTPAGSSRSKYNGVGPGTRQLQGGDVGAEEVARYGGYMATDGDLATLLTAVNTAVAAGTVVFR